ncbi:hypothetical protein SSOG_06031 [Streptomyces himastatinicus ATCC 53653]|uniref:Uncharacterized protein n=1 Tax=Streptomyces himastatinicus ATCC 53653 TaxID=457427 RepID=D9WT96_9ACTN|nr:hypothetical protein SSOG_06031 [Streptomyces himastatinicus ATCC 53653]
MKVDASGIGSTTLLRAASMRCGEPAVGHSSLAQRTECGKRSAIGFRVSWLGQFGSHGAAS